MPSHGLSQVQVIIRKNKVSTFCCGSASLMWTAMNAAADPFVRAVNGG